VIFSEKACFLFSYNYKEYVTLILSTKTSLRFFDIRKQRRLVSSIYSSHIKDTMMIKLV